MVRSSWPLGALVLAIALAAVLPGLDIARSEVLGDGVAGAPTATPGAPTAEGVHTTFSLGIETDPATLLGTTGIVDGLWIQWQLAGTCPAGSGTVQYREPGGSTSVASGSVVGQTTYGGTGTMHGAKIPLVGGATTLEYRIRCGLDTLFPWTPIRMPPPASGTIRIASWADIGTPGYHDGAPYAGATSSPFLIQDQILDFDPHMLLIPGDLSYADRSAKDPVTGNDLYEPAEIWTAFNGMFAPTFSTVPTMPVAGNHEFENDATRYHQFSERWVLPDDELHYGFRAGPVSVISMASSEACMAGTGPDSRCPKSAQGPNAATKDRLLAELIRAYNSGTSWTIVQLHHAVYSDGGSHDAQQLIQEEWVPLFQQYGVDLVLTGHEHNYQRSHPLVNGNARQTGTNDYDDEGTLYMVLGGGGRALYGIDQAVAAPWRKVANDSDHQHVQITASPTTLHVEVVSAETGSMIDAFTITK